MSRDGCMAIFGGERDWRYLVGRSQGPPVPGLGGLVGLVQLFLPAGFGPASRVSVVSGKRPATEAVAYAGRFLNTSGNQTSSAGKTSDASFGTLRGLM